LIKLFLEDTNSCWSTGHAWLLV